MSLSNKYLFIFFRFLLAALVIIIIGDFFLSKIDGSIGGFFSNHYFAGVAAILILVLALLRMNYFFYEDEYEIIHVHSKSLVFGLIGIQEHRYEFPKVILKSFKYKGGLAKILKLHIESSNGEVRIKKFNLLFVSSDKIDLMLKSLERIVERNKKLK
jgi:hypothetical protein